MKIAIALIVFFISSHSLGDEYKWNVEIGRSGYAVLFNTESGEYYSKEAVEKVPKSTWIKYFVIYVTENNTQFQNEVHAYLSLNYHDLLSGALNSAGNMHNPRVLAIHEAFKKAIMVSSMKNDLNLALQSRCENIESVSFEKFEVSKNNNKPVFSGLLWLTTEKCI